MPAHCSQEALWDRRRDELKHEPRPGDPPHRLDRMLTTALEVAVLVQVIDLTAGAELIEQYAQTVAAGARLDGVQQAYDRINVALESPVRR